MQNNFLCGSIFALGSLTLLLPGADALAGGFKVLHTFTGASGDGNDPQGALVADGSGAYYSTTNLGGDSNNGTIFKVSPGGKTATVYSFAGAPNDGSEPTFSLIRDKKGNFYSTTSGGGPANNGTVFRLTPDGKESVLYSFQGGNDGVEPFGGVTADKAGNLYGTTFFGGANNDGTVYKLASDGTETVLHTFSDDDGAEPIAGLLLDARGNIYGTTTRGGSNGDGVVFKITPDGIETTLYDFSGDDGANPYCGLIVDKAGDLYGTTGDGGAEFAGTVFKLTTKGKLTNLYVFQGGRDGDFPTGNLTFDADGNLYGTTAYGGDLGVNGCANRLGCGVAFRLSPKGKEKVLHTFNNVSDGGNPSAALTLDEKGRIYGTASFGGGDEFGTIFQIK